ncbi:MAG: zinc-dependent metalloprotease, partial [Chitinophagaceae bacterium]
NNVNAQYTRYLGHVANNIGLMKWNFGTVEQGGTFFSFQDREKIRSAVQFFNRELFTTPDWLFNAKQFLAGTGSGLIALQKKQEVVISALTDAGMWNWLFFNETSLPKGKSYSYNELLNDFEAEFFKELDKQQTIGMARRNLQKTYVVQLLYNVRVGMPGMASMMEYGHVLIAHLEKLHMQVSAALPGYKDPESKKHLAFIRDELAMMLRYQKTMYPEENTAWRVPNAQRSDKRVISPFTEPVNEPVPAERSCWDATPSFFMDK